MMPMKPDNVAKRVYGPAPAGRPPGAGKYVVRPAAPTVPEGFELTATTPDVMKRVKEQYMQNVSDKELPPALQPKRFRPQQTLTNRHISEGMSPKFGKR